MLCQTGALTAMFCGGREIPLRVPTVLYLHIPNGKWQGKPPNHNPEMYTINPHTLECENSAMTKIAMLL